eukprot:scaffold27889_cov67-Phaeocystis_antarctica.AAC.2
MKSETASHAASLAANPVRAVRPRTNSKDEPLMVAVPVAVLLKVAGLAHTKCWAFWARGGMRDAGTQRPTAQRRRRP